MLPLLANSVDLTPYLIALVGSGGVVGAIVGVFRITGDRDSQAVTQAQGAMETMQALNEALEDALKRANERGDYYKRLYEEKTAEFDRVWHQWGPFPNGDEA